MGLGSCFSKYVLFFFNLACALLGLAILGIGVYTNIHGRSVKDLLDGELNLTTILLIVVGGAVFLIAFFGCCGAIREDPCCLNTYGVILSALLLCQIAVGVLAFVNRNKVDHVFSKYIEEEFDKATREDRDSVRIISELQKDIQCCGLTGPNFWLDHGKPVPASCCPRDSSCNVDDAFQDGCKDKAIYLVKQFLYLIGVAAIAVGGVELLGVIFAFCLASSIKRRELRGYA